MMDTMEDKSLCGLIKFHSAKLAEVAKDTEKLQASIDNEVVKAYQKGFEDGKAVNNKGCEGCEYESKAGTCPMCSICSNNYKNYWTAKDDRIEVGDEVNRLGNCFIVTRIYQPYGKKEQCDGIDDDGDVYRAVLIESLVKTGRHFDIDKILEAMKE